MPKSINKSPQVLPVPDAVLERLAELGHVPAARRKFFFETVCANVQRAWELGGLNMQGRASKQGALLQRTALALYEALGNVDKDERETIEGILGGKLEFSFDQISSGRVGELRQTLYRLAFVFSIRTGKPPLRPPYEAPQPPQRGRKPGAVKDWVFQHFVGVLLATTTLAGGRLTLEKNIGKGSLIDAINALAPYLPDGFVPEPMPVSTFQRLKDFEQRDHKGGKASRLGLARRSL